MNDRLGDRAGRDPAPADAAASAPDRGGDGASDRSRVRLLTFSTLFPNAVQPTHGVFVENRLRHLVASGEVVSTVLAPVPWFPRAVAGVLPSGRGGGRLDRWARMSRVPAVEDRHGLAVHHPRFAAIPMVGMSAAPALLARATLPAIERLMAAGVTFDAIDAHYLYPDGVAALRLARRLGKPVVITARGSDVTLLPDFRAPRRMIVDALARADALVAVSAALRDAMIALGAAPDRVTVLRNGVDTRLFRPLDREAARAEFGVAGRLIVSVGGLIERKGHHLTIAALRELPDCTLLIAGEGPDGPRLQALAASLGVADRVRLLGSRPHASLPSLYSAADVMVLASSREGWANVLLESMACGTPVVATNIWGNPEVVRSREAGVIVPERTAEALAAGVRNLLAAPPPRAATRAYAEPFSWDETTAGQIALFRRLTDRLN